MKIYNYESIPKYSDFKYWFTKEGTNWAIYIINPDKTATRASIATINDFGVVAKPVDYSDISISDVSADFQLFKQRPEYEVGRLPEGDDVEFYEKLILGTLLLRYFNAHHEAPDTFIGSAARCLDWLRSTDFYTAPASTIYHESYPGGLVHHTLEVYKNGLDLLNITKFQNVDVVSFTICALTHDWCKIGFYEVYEKNVKDEKTGQWSKQPAFRVNQVGIPLGHGVSSMFLASKFFRLTPDEALAIRWHMGRFRVVDDEINEMQKANETYPLVHLLQFADQLSIVQY